MLQLGHASAVLLNRSLSHVLLLCLSCTLPLWLELVKFKTRKAIHTHHFCMPTCSCVALSVTWARIVFLACAIPKPQVKDVNIICAVL